MRKAIKDIKYTIEDDHYYYLVAQNVKKYRVIKNYTQQELADMTGMSREYICDIENPNRNKHLAISKLGRISDVLGVEMGKFFEEN